MYGLDSRVGSHRAGAKEYTRTPQPSQHDFSEGRLCVDLRVHDQEKVMQQ